MQTYFEHYNHFYSLFIIMTIFLIKKLVANEGIPIFKEDGKLYFHKMGGSGELHCKLCNNTEEIINFTHGYERPPDVRISHPGGYQFEDCKKFN
jgi:hypothetical protein